MKAFGHVCPDNCIPLPLFGSLAAEEQARVLEFDDGAEPGQRMVVFR